MFIRIKVTPNKNFTLKGYDLYTKAYITPWEAALGTQIEVKGIDDTEKIKIKSGTTTGEQIVLENKGFRDKSGKRGNLICSIAIMMPD